MLGIWKGRAGAGGLKRLVGNATIAMLTIDWADGVAVDFMNVGNCDDLHEMLRQICGQLGCSYYALSHHVDFLGSPGTGIRVHNYPEEWAVWFDRERLGLTDPVHRASQRTSAGFIWHNVSKMIELRASDRDVFFRAKRHGIGDGLTIPAHVPGDAHGSCSFAWRKGQIADRRALVAAQSVSNFAFEAARRVHSPIILPRRRLTDRQREVLRWSARGKTDWEISKIMEISEPTVLEHMRNARGRYDVTSRTPLAVRALFDGTLHFGDVAELGYPRFLL